MWLFVFGSREISLVPSLALGLILTILMVYTYSCIYMVDLVVLTFSSVLSIPPSPLPSPPPQSVFGINHLKRLCSNLLNLKSYNLISLTSEGQSNFCKGNNKTKHKASTKLVSKHCEDKTKTEQELGQVKLVSKLCEDKTKTEQELGQVKLVSKLCEDKTKTEQELGQVKLVSKLCEDKTKTEQELGQV